MDNVSKAEVMIKTLWNKKYIQNTKGDRWSSNFAWKVLLTHKNKPQKLAQGLNSDKKAQGHSSNLLDFLVAIEIQSKPPKYFDKVVAVKINIKFSIISHKFS